MKKRILWLDLLRIIGIFGVIIIHIVGNTINTFNLSGTSYIVYNIICKCCYFTLPLFIMISGSLLLNKDIFYKEIVKKYLRRMILVLLSFGSIFVFIEEYYTTRKVSLNIISKIIKRIIAGNLWAHMWFIYLIIGIYLLTPIFRKWVKNSNNHEQLIFLIILYIFTILKNEISVIFNIEISFYIPISSGFILAYLLGNYLYNNDIPNLIKRIIHISSFLAVIIIIILTYLNIGTTLIEYTSTLTIIIATDVYLSLKGKDIKNQKIKTLITSLGQYVFGIYVIHQLFINILYKLLKINIIIDYPYICLPIYTLIIFICSLISTYILRKNNIIKKYIL